MPAYHRVRVLPRARVRLQWCNRRTTPLPTDPYLRVGALSLSLALEPTTWRPFGTASGGVRVMREQEFYYGRGPYRGIVRDS